MGDSLHTIIGNINGVEKNKGKSHVGYTADAYYDVLNALEINKRIKTVKSDKHFSPTSTEDDWFNDYESYAPSDSSYGSLFPSDDDD
jgi:hypothetical protein